MSCSVFPEARGVPCEPQHLAASCTPRGGRDAHRSRHSLSYGLLNRLRAVKTSCLTKYCGRVGGLIWTRHPAGLCRVIQAARCMKKIVLQLFPRRRWAAHTSTARDTAQSHPAGHSVPMKGSAVPTEVQTWLWSLVSHQCKSALATLKS